jgi:hypothetical protein
MHLYMYIYTYTYMYILISLTAIYIHITDKAEVHKITVAVREGREEQV